ncbi:MAG: RluA family pseudouridine synthase [Candidatus Uhrbacteria bacterium]
MVQHFKVKDTDDGARFDVYLSEVLSLSRGKVQRLIKDGIVMVNGKLAKSGLKLSTGDEIEVPEIQEYQRVKISAAELDILFEDDDVIVINKPSGLLVHRANETDHSSTLVDGLLAHYPEIATVGDDPVERPGIVHRLDKTASGVMIVAKNQEAFEHLKEQFRSRRAQKKYIALVYGKIDEAAGEINFRIGRSKRTGKMVAKPANEAPPSRGLAGSRHGKAGGKGKEAITLFEVIDRFAVATLLRVEIKTGRTHQIRAHLQAYDHPVVGDPLYKKKQMTNIRPIELGRLFLHAAKLTIELPSGETKTFEAPLPDELANLLTKLKK